MGSGRFYRLLGTGLLTAALCVSPAAAECLHANTDGQVAEGKLRVGRFTDGMGRPEQAYILQLRARVCLDGSDQDNKVDRSRTIHIFATDTATQRRLQSLVGKTIRVSGNPFVAHTVHHHAPIVLRVTKIDAP